LRELPHGPVQVEDFQIVHGSPVDEDEYLVSLHEAREAFGFADGQSTKEREEKKRRTRNKLWKWRPVESMEGQNQASYARDVWVAGA
jgi:hypothetical protein